MSRSAEIRSQFYQQIGQCITSWSLIEASLFSICHAALGCDRKRAAIVFGRTPTLEARIALTDDLLRSVFPKEGRKSGGHDPAVIEKWAGAQKKLRELLPTRNAIAHRPLTEVVYMSVSNEDMLEKLASLEVGEGLTLRPSRLLKKSVARRDSA